MSKTDRPAFSIPDEALSEGWRDLRLGSDVPAPLISYETSVRVFLAALVDAGWTISPPHGAALLGSANRDTPIRTGSMSLVLEERQRRAAERARS